jgi:hypothetical protein
MQASAVLKKRSQPCWLTMSYWNCPATAKLIQSIRRSAGKTRTHVPRTLQDQPWKSCGCVICEAIGVEVIIFRGNDRNRRRGFHNTYVFYERFQELLKQLNADSAKLGISQ